MNIQNAYATLTQLQAYLPNSANITESMAIYALNAASREIDRNTGRLFYPEIKTNYYNTPKNAELWLYDDLLEVLALTNGDGTTMTATTDYLTVPYNAYPKYKIVLNPETSTYFETSDTTDYMKAIQVNGIYGYHRNYSLAWFSGTTLGAAMTDTTSTSVTLTASTNFEEGQIIKVDSEMMLVTDKPAATTLTVVRGWNGSTAATHLISASVYIWQAEPDITMACLIQASRLYNRQNAIFGTIGGGEMGATPITLTKLDPDVQRIIEKFRSAF
jgi:hypothetical protein